MKTSIDGGDLLTVDHYAADDTGGVVLGRFAERVCLKEGLFAEPDPEHCMRIEGIFNIKLPLAAD